MSIKITLKHGKTKHKNVEVIPSEGLEVLKAQVFAVTSVPVERQKLILKGKVVDDDAGLSKLKKRSVLTIMGSAEVAAEAPKEAIVFMEDMTQAERAELSVALPPGLQNLQNTCYLNATLQAVKAIPELVGPIKEFSTNSKTPGVSAELGKLFAQMGRSEDAVTPMNFVNVFRQAFPIFGERSPKTGGFMQHDADEAYTQIIQSIKREVKDKDGTDLIAQEMTGEYEVKRNLSEDGVDEKEETYTEPFDKVQCFIDGETNHVLFGVQKALTQNIERNSPTLGRNAMYREEKRIGKLPNVLCVQFVRFFWKNKIQKKAKIMRKIVFPEKMDVREWCSTEVREKIGAYRRAKLEWEDRMREKRQAVAVSPTADAAPEKPPEKPEEEAAEASEDQDAEEAELAAAMAMSMETDDAPADDQKESDKPTEMDVDTEPAAKRQKTGEEFVTGDYELISLICHKGRSSDSGHYIGYAKGPDGNLVKYDDDKVTPCDKEEHKRLYGGGDRQMAYIAFYRKIPPVEFKED